jgi:predicted DNA-binding protein
MSNTPDNVDTAKPARMIRKQVRITIEQNQQMKRIAATMGRTEADLLREAVA